MDKQTPSRRKRLTAEREREILDATFELVAEVGYDQATVDEVARHPRPKGTPTP